MQVGASTALTLYDISRSFAAHVIN